MILTLIATLAALVLGALEWRRPDPRWRTARGVASVLAVLALAALLAPSPPPARDGGGVLVTEGATPALVRRVADSLEAAVFVLPEAGAARAFGANARRVADLPALLRREPGLRRLTVTGWGLDPAAAGAAVPMPSGFVAAPAPAGIATLRWPRRAQVGSVVPISGSTTGIAPGTTIHLDGPGGPVDSASVSADSTFTLSARARAAGLISYMLRVDHGGMADTAGIEVVAPTPPRLLVLDDAPSFESRYLKDWMAREGADVVVRTRVSRGRYRTVSVNVASTDVAVLTPALLGRFDVILSDAPALAALSPGERDALERAVRERGLGLVVTAGAVAARLAGHGLLTAFQLHTTPGGGLETQVRWNGSVTSPRATRAPYQLGLDGAVRSLAWDSTGHPLAAWAGAGAGAVAVTLVTAPSHWALTGDDATFRGYWALLLDAVARPTDPGWEIGMAGPLLVDRPMTLRRSGTEMTPVIVVQDPAGARDSVFLSEDAFEPGLWTGTYWPRQAGWYRIIDGTAAPRFDVRGDDEWHAWQATARTASMQARIVSQPAGERRRSRRQIPRAVWFGALFAAVALLWGERAV